MSPRPNCEGEKVGSTWIRIENGAGGTRKRKLVAPPLCATQARLDRTLSSLDQLDAYSSWNVRSGPPLSRKIDPHGTGTRHVARVRGVRARPTVEVHAVAVLGEAKRPRGSSEREPSG